MELIFEVNNWVDVSEDDNELIIENSDDSGNNIKLRLRKGLMFQKRWIKQLKKDFAKLGEKA